MNTYDKLKLHLERHAYKRGAFKGDAPADASRRGLTHFRVRYARDDTMCVRMYNTDIITAYPDGRVVINTNGFYDRPTTRKRFNEATRAFISFRCTLLTTKHKGLSQPVVYVASQPVVYVASQRYRYYDGMEFNAEGKLLTPERPFEKRMIDKEEAKEFAREVKESGFKDLWPVMFAAAQLPDYMEAREFAYTLRDINAIITDADQAAKWPMLVAIYKYPQCTSHYNRALEYDRAGAWDALMRRCKKGMYVVLADEPYDTPTT